MNPKFQGTQHQKRRYAKVCAKDSLGGFICEPHEAQGMVDDPGEYDVSEVWMTPIEFDALPEFQGF